MTTKRRLIDLSGELHFVTFSTYQRRRFLAPDRTKTIVLEALQTCLEKHRVLCHGFVVMPDHVHAVLSVPPESEIALFLLAWKKTSSYRIKSFYLQELIHYQGLCPKDCPAWQARFYDFNLGGTDKLNEKLEYMHHNPVKAGLVQMATEWKWSSARFYGFGQDVNVTVTPLW